MPVMKSPNLRTLDLNLLRVFDEVMAERNLTRAANKLAMTQPAVSNALNRLRDALGDRLVVRSGYGVEPTPKALALWPAIADALRQIESSLAPGEFVPMEANTTFVLAMADATAAELMPGLVEILQEEAPGVSMRVLPLATRDPRRMLEEGMMDMAVGFFPPVIADLAVQEQAGRMAAFERQRLFGGEYVCVMRKGHALAKGSLTIKRYCDARHLRVSFSGRPFGFVDEALMALGRQRRVVLTVNQFFTAGRVVASSDLLAVLPKHFVSVTGMADEFALPLVLVDALWHRREAQRNDHAWLRTAVATAAQKAFAGRA